MSVIFTDLAHLSPAAAIASPATLSGLRQTVSVDGPDVALSDLFDINLLPADLRDASAALWIARFPPATASIVVSSRRVAERVRSLIPALAPFFPNRPESLIQIQRKGGALEAAKPTMRNCFKAQSQIEAGAIPIAADFVAADCGASLPKTPFHYDTHQHAVVAERPISTGEILAAPLSFTLASVRPGQRLILRSHVGVVTIERAVQALQAAQPGQSLFVAAADQSIFAVQSSEVQP